MFAGAGRHVDLTRCEFNLLEVRLRERGAWLTTGEAGGMRLSRKFIRLIAALTCMSARSAAEVGMT